MDTTKTTDVARFDLAFAKLFPILKVHLHHITVSPQFSICMDLGGKTYVVKRHYLIRKKIAKREKMPRAKVKKNLKRNRESQIRDEKICEFESADMTVKDEGHPAEDISAPCSSGTVAKQQAKNLFPLPVPLNSARARCPKRRRSACDEHSSSIGMESGARNEMVPGEMVVSKYGSPAIAQTLPDRFANVNIPLRDGAMSLRPNPLLDEVQADILESHGMDPQTLSELRILRDNIEEIINMADNIINRNDFD
uniref:Borealin C-terminal domain-containing protein n=1 Tax=Glossina austeni TaxID=7395 RepID=A0A1A9VBR1_GLOAU